MSFFIWIFLDVNIILHIRLMVRIPRQQLNTHNDTLLLIKASCLVFYLENSWLDRMLLSFFILIFTSL